LALDLHIDLYSVVGGADFTVQYKTWVNFLRCRENDANYMIKTLRGYELMKRFGTILLLWKDE
jgi:hypothetical protein